LNSVQIPKCPALNTADFIITIFTPTKSPKRQRGLGGVGGGGRRVGVERR
jgi:hypothetical protein